MRTKLQKLSTEVNYTKLRLLGAKAAIVDAHKLIQRLKGKSYPIKTEGIACMIAALESSYRQQRAMIRREQDGHRS